MKMGLKNSPAKIKMTRYIQRELEQELRKYLKLPQILAIIGPRRSGKTTFLKHLQKKLSPNLYLSFEDQKILDLFNQDIESFAKLYLIKTKYLILDEFHYAKFGGKNLKYLFDFYPGKKIMISGSSSLELTIKALKYLVGRVLSFELLPFSFAEFVRAKEENLLPLYQEYKKKLLEKNLPKIAPALCQRFNHLLEEYLLFGGYPEVVLAKNLEVKKTLLTGIYSLYFLKEVRDIIGLMDDYKLKSLIRALSLQIGNICQYQELSSLSLASFPTLKKYLNFLEKTFICFFPKPFFTNKRTELSKNPKVYFFDLGLRNSVLDNFLPLEKRGDQGALFENFVASALKKQGKLHFWRTKARAEVDFILEREGKIIPIEVKANIAKPTASFLSFVKKYQPSEGYIYNLEFAGKQKVGKTTIYFLPIFLVAG